jgi:predicted nucleic acid-binding protein
MSFDEAQKAYIILDSVPVEIINSSSARQLAREIAKQFNQRFVYDANYAALAEIYNCEFWTADKVFYNAVKSDLKYVRYLPDYL